MINIPPVLSVSCGLYHTLIITNDSNLWSCGKNDFGQLCLGKELFQSKLRQTSFSNISKISAGSRYSLFQNDKGEIFSCGYNCDGEVALGHFNHPQIMPTLIPNLPPNIIQFVSGGFHNLFLDAEGKVFSVGYNFDGQLGLGHNENQNVLNQIPNIPPIQFISCGSTSSYLIDFEGNLWSFGHNKIGQLGLGDVYDSRNVPTKIEHLIDIRQISYGCCAPHFLAKDSQNTIYVSGDNRYGQHGTGIASEPVSTPKEINSEYFSIWGEGITCKAKSARK